jgi:hypothetical protein
MRNSKGGKDLAREEKLQIMVAPEELEAVDQPQIPASHAEPGSSGS